jgi:hypothetical protein
VSDVAGLYFMLCTGTLILLQSECICINTYKFTLFYADLGGETMLLMRSVFSFISCLVCCMPTTV